MKKRIYDTKKKPLLKDPVTYLAIITLLLFIILAILISKPSPVTNLDLKISNYIPNLWNPILNNIMLFITNIGGTIVLSVLTIILALFFLFTKKYKNFLFLALTMVLGLIAEYVLKLIFHRLRPIDQVVDFTRYSFPSGHALMSLIFFTILVITIKDYIKNKTLLKTFIKCNILLILFIGFSRIYLDYHWLSDVIAGYLFAGFLVSLVYLIIKR